MKNSNSIASHTEKTFVHLLVKQSVSDGLIGKLETVPNIYLEQLCFNPQ